MAALRNRALPERVAACLQAAAIDSEAHLCVALSGGVDSSVLLHCLAVLQCQTGFLLSAAHVHHGLSCHADDWSAHCARICAALKVPLRVFKVAVDQVSPLGLEAAARQARMNALATITCDWLVFAHHRNDQAETVLFRLLRGTGVRGLAAMSERTPGAAGQPGRLRPLLSCRRRCIETYARQDGLRWVDDDSNENCRHNRNWLRREVLPLLETRFPDAANVLARTAEHCREANSLLDDLAERDEQDCGVASWSRRRLLDLSSARLRNLLRWRIQCLGLLPPPANQLEELERQLRAVAQAPLRFCLPGCVCLAYREHVWLECTPAGDLAEALRWNGEASLQWGTGSLSFRPQAGKGLALASLEAAQEVLIRSRWQGARMRLHAHRPRRDFKHLFQEAAVPPWLRERLPVLCVDGQAAWAAAVGVSADFACPPGQAGLVPYWQWRATQY